MNCNPFSRRHTIGTQTDPSTFCISQDRCTCCMKSVWMTDCRSFSCGHTFCMECITRLLISQIEFNEQSTQLSCPICLKSLTLEEMNSIDPSFIDIMNKREEKIITEEGPIVECPKCNLGFFYEPGERADITVAPNGKPIPPAALECLRINRCTCCGCQTTFCVNCHSSPFHDGYTCEEQKLINDGITCRFCMEPVLGGEQISPAKRVCNDPTCRLNLKTACTHMLDCGHPCCGLKGEKEHLPCSECEGSLCCYCGDSLSVMPSIALECGHFCHRDCVFKHLDTCSLTKRIILPHCGFPGCNALPKHLILNAKISQYAVLASKIDKMLHKQMEIEKTAEDDRVLNPDDEDYYQKPEALARATFLFFMCEKCGEPYYGGHKECGGEDAPEEHYLCNTCGKIGLSTCPKHGTDGMIYKCFFCCNEASWFCWGTTHFCDPCHRRWQDAMKGPWPKCNGKCQFAPHPSNGTKEIYGFCAICRSERMVKGASE